MSYLNSAITEWNGYTHLFSFSPKILLKLNVFFGT